MEQDDIESTNDCDFKLNRLNTQLNQIIKNFNNYREDFKLNDFLNNVYIDKRLIHFLYYLYYYIFLS